jgi:hypothetical protein
LVPFFFYLYEMAQLSLYKSIYKITNGVTYELITPNVISGSTYDESGVNLIEELEANLYSQGIYYVNIDADKYNADTIYQLHWTIKYNLSSPLKKIINYFRFKLDAKFSNQVFIEVQETPLLFQTMQQPIFVQIIPQNI